MVLSRFSRDIRKKDSFQIMYEVFKDENGRVIENGSILCKFEVKWKK